MHITFYGKHNYWGGLANGGGSRTILLSAQELRELGHGVDIVACSDKFTWFPHPPIKHEVSKNTDVVIANSISDVKEIMEQYPDKKLAYWSRPFEIDVENQKWQMSEEKALRRMLKFYRKGGIIMSNSKWQCDYLKLHGIKSHLIYSGQDIECEDKRPDYNGDFPLVIGCQYSSKPRKGWKEFKKIVKMLGTEKYEYVSFGSEKCKAKFLSEYIRNGSRQQINELYQKMDVFVCCSSLEGFYNPGVEAAINGCLLMVNDNPRNGAMDYTTESTAYIYESNLIPWIGVGGGVQLNGACYDNVDFETSLSDLDFSKVAKCQKLIREKIGTRKSCMKKMVEVLK
jgi:glycosyltransferase involved in cell wall biosynthesis